MDQHRQLMSLQQTQFEKCKEAMGDDLRYMGTSTVVRDIEEMSRVLEGEDAPINFFGGSYGCVALPSPGPSTFRQPLTRVPSLQHNSWSISGQHDPTQDRQGPDRRGGLLSSVGALLRTPVTARLTLTPPDGRMSRPTNGSQTGWCTPRRLLIGSSVIAQR